MISNMKLLQELINKHAGNDVYIFGDFNAKSSLWGIPLLKSVDPGDHELEFCIKMII